MACLPIKFFISLYTIINSLKISCHNSFMNILCLLNFLKKIFKAMHGVNLAFQCALSDSATSTVLRLF